MGSSAWVIATDMAWTLVCVMGVYYGVGLVRHASAGYRYSAHTFPKRRTREQFRLNRVAGVLLLIAELLGSILGLIVVGTDGYLLWTDQAEVVDARRLVYRCLLIAVMLLIALALRKMWQVYEMWGEERS
jgi:hypothetical protein